MKNKADHSETSSAELVLRCKDLEANLSLLEDIGFKLESIFPADAPREAVVSGFGMRLCLERSETGPDPVSTKIRIPGRVGPEISAPCGATFVFGDRNNELVVPKPVVSFQVSRFDAKWVEGRAGMRYRDLIPDRLGGYLIASHIHIPEAGPVPDYVHYHDIIFQVIYCRKGWARLVYEDQGEPFVFEAGDCVLQPPGIRHRVLESSKNLEVIEVSCPAEHITYADNEIELPNGLSNPDRLFDGQRFVWSRASEASWLKMPGAGMEYRDTGIEQATGGIAGVRVLRLAPGREKRFGVQNGRLTIYIFLTGNCSLRIDKEKEHEIKCGDTATIPKGTRYTLDDCSDDLEILEISVSND